MATAADRGWGPGWPNCQTEKWSWYEAAGHRWLLRDEAAPVLLAFIERFHAEVEPLDPTQCWSAACRPIRGSTTIPSEHSWAKAVDLNSAKHPRGAHGTFTAAQVRRIRAILAEPAFRNIRWGIDFDYVDEHHFEYLGTPAAADADAALLNQEDDDMTKDQFFDWMDEWANSRGTATGSRGYADSVDDDRAKFNALVNEVRAVAADVKALRGEPT